MNRRILFIIVFFIYNSSLFTTITIPKLQILAANHPAIIPQAHEYIEKEYKRDYPFSYDPCKMLLAIERTNVFYYLHKIKKINELYNYSKEHNGLYAECIDAAAKKLSCSILATQLKDLDHKLIVSIFSKKLLQKKIRHYIPTYFKNDIYQTEGKEIARFSNKYIYITDATLSPSSQYLILYNKRGTLHRLYFYDLKNKSSNTLLPLIIFEDIGNFSWVGKKYILGEKIVSYNYDLNFIFIFEPKTRKITKLSDKDIDFDLYDSCIGSSSQNKFIIPSKTKLAVYEITDTNPKKIAQVTSEQQIVKPSICFKNDDIFFLTLKKDFSGNSVTTYFNKYNLKTNSLVFLKKIDHYAGSPTRYGKPCLAISHSNKNCALYEPSNAKEIKKTTVYTLENRDIKSKPFYFSLEDISIGFKRFVKKTFFSNDDAYIILLISGSSSKLLDIRSTKTGNSIHTQEMDRRILINNTYFLIHNDPFYILKKWETPSLRELTCKGALKNASPHFDQLLSIWKSSTYKSLSYEAQERCNRFLQNQFKEYPKMQLQLHNWFKEFNHPSSALFKSSIVLRHSELPLLNTMHQSKNVFYK